MKMRKSLPLILVAPLLLGGCNGSLFGEIESPEFDAYSGETTKEEFGAKEAAAFAAEDLFTNLSELPSFKFEGKNEQHSVLSVKRDGKEILGEESYEGSEYKESGYNKDAKMLKLSAELSYISVTSNKEDSLTQTSAYKQELIYQEIDVEEVPYTCSVNVDEKTVEPYIPASYMPVASFAGMMLEYLVDEPWNLSDLTDHPEAYKFYVDGNDKLFTVVYSFADREEEIKDSDDAVVGKLVESAEMKAQMLVSGNTMKALAYIKSSGKVVASENMTFESDYFLRKGDELEYKTEASLYSLADASEGAFTTPAYDVSSFLILE